MKYGNYIPEHFVPEELFPRKTISDHTNNGIIAGSVWRLIDSRIAWTADQLRERFGVMVANDYKFGGDSQYRGYRPPVELIDQKQFKNTGQIVPTFSSFTSQHCFGRALDLIPKKVTAQEIREDIRKNPLRYEYQFITAVEKDVSWFHFDVRNYGTENGVLFF